jgi:hypothetical protein
LVLAAGVVLILGAAGALVLSDDLRWLRLGIVAALWAALVGAFIAARYRGQVGERDDRAADLQAVYELELEREIAARREYELQVEAEIRAEVDEQSRRDVAALRDELRTLRQTLETLMGGEVLVERYALAQSTRMRPIQERKHLPAAVNGPPPEPVTEVFERVTELRPVKTGPRSVPALPRRADRAERPPWPTPVRQPTGEHPAPDPRVAELPPPAVAHFRPPSAEPPPPSPEVNRIRSLAEESLSRIQRVQQPRTEQWRPEPPPPPQVIESSPPRMAPPPPPRADQSRPRMQPPPPRRDAFPPPRTEAFPPPRAEQSIPRIQPPPPVEAPPQREVERIRSLAEESLSRIERLQAPPPEPRPWNVDPAPRTAWEERPVAEQSRPGRHSEPPTGGRRRRSEPEPPPRRHARPDETEQPGGRRRKAEDTPSWQELATWDPVVKATSRTWAGTGSHARERDPEPEPQSGSHASGHSVADLLAQHGQDPPRRRRRREE